LLRFPFPTERGLPVNVKNINRINREETYPDAVFSWMYLGMTAKPFGVTALKRTAVKLRRSSAFAFWRQG
jgi:hypothetical protein